MPMSVTTLKNKKGAPLIQHHILDKIGYFSVFKFCDTFCPIGATSNSLYEEWYHFCAFRRRRRHHPRRRRAFEAVSPPPRRLWWLYGRKAASTGIPEAPAWPKCRPRRPQDGLLRLPPHPPPCSSIS